MKAAAFTLSYGKTFGGAKQTMGFTVAARAATPALRAKLRWQEAYRIVKEQLVEQGVLQKKKPNMFFSILGDCFVLPRHFLLLLLLIYSIAMNIFPRFGIASHLTSQARWLLDVVIES